MPVYLAPAPLFEREHFRVIKKFGSFSSLVMTRPWTSYEYSSPGLNWEVLTWRITNHRDYFLCKYYIIDVGNDL